MSQRGIVLSADTPCDIGSELKARYHVSLFPLHILLGDEQFTDGVDITAEQIYAAWREKKILPRTAAINPEEYRSYFLPFLEQGYDVLHISLGSGLSSSYQNAQIAAESLANAGKVYVVDSCSLSTGFGLLVCEAGERIKRGLDIQTIHDEIVALAPCTRASFVLDTLEFMRAGGRCSSVAQLSAALMNIKPSILVKNEQQGGMGVGKKYVGRLEHAMLKYVDNQLAGRSDIVLDRVFITHSTMDEDRVAVIVSRVRQLQPFREVFVTTASCTISAHCGPNCLGVLFMVKPEA